MARDRAQFMKELAEKAAQQKDTGPPIPEQIALLAVASKRYVDHAGGCPFNVGDLITPRSDSFYPHAGLPHVVLEVFDEVDPSWADMHVGTTRDGAMYNVRVGVWRNGSMAAFWCESWCFEFFNEASED